MTDYTQCPGCGHHYGRPMSSTPNEHGYCHWCRDEGVFDAASDAESSAKWQAFHAERERRERDELERMQDGW